MMGWDWDAGTWLGMVVVMLVWIVLAVVVVWLTVRGLIALERTRTDAPSVTTPDDILRERLARGEIDAAEFERKLTLLRGK
jgi:putative membrane protein